MGARTADPRAAFGAALALTIAIAVIDVAVGSATELASLLVCGPLLAAWLTGPRETAVVGAVAVALALLDGLIDEAFFSMAHVVGMLAVATGSVLAVLVARARSAEASAQRQTALLTHAGEVFERGDPLRELDELAGLAVPEMADACIVDLVDDDGRATVGALRAADPSLAEQLRAVRDDAPVGPSSEHPVAVVTRTGEAQLIEEMSDEDHARYATSEGHLRLMRERGYRSAVVVPLSARGRLVGTLSWIRLRGRDPFGEHDLRLAREFARRAGLAIDHARLFGALESTEAQMQGVLGALAEAVTVQAPNGELLYANRAAAELLGVPDEATLIEGGATRAWQHWDARDERGEAIDPARLPGRQALNGVAHPEPLLMRVTDRRTGEVFWRLVKASPVFDAEGHPRLAVNVIEDVTETRRDELKQRFLAQASKLLSSSLDISVTLEKVAWAAVPELADWCAVDMPDERGRLKRVATADVEGGRRDRDSLIVGESAREGELPVGPPQVLRTGRPELYAQIDDELLRAASRDEAQFAALRKVRPLSALVVPLIAGERTIGTITLGTTHDSGRRLNEADLELAEELGRRAGAAIENASVHADRVSIAATLQEALLPPSLPEAPGLSLAARFRAAGQSSWVGGDFYDVFRTGDAWMAFMGDVTGKGPAAASTTALARHTMRTAAKYEPSPSRVLARLNEALLDARGAQLCTAVCLRLEPGGDGVAVTLACAGHPPPLLLRPDGAVVPVGEPGALLGAFAQGEWAEDRLRLAGGESLVLYTDGVTDTRGVEERFGFDRLHEVVAGGVACGADALAARIDDALLAFQDGAQRDDVAVLVVQASGGPTRAAGKAAVVGEARS